MSRYRIHEEPSAFDPKRSYWYVSGKDGWLSSWTFIDLFDTFEQAEKFVDRRIQMRDNVKYYE